MKYACYMISYINIGGIIMHSNDKLLYSEINQWDIDYAQEFLYQIDKEYFENYSVCPIPISNKIFRSTDDFSNVAKPHFENCIFFSPSLNGMTGENSVFINNKLYKCHIQNSNFRFSNFSDCTFFHVSITNSSIEDMEFKDNKLINCRFNGCSWSNSYLKDCIISNLTTEYCDFDSATLSNITIADTNFLSTGFNYVEFDHVTIKNVVFPLIDFFHTFNGLTILSKYSDDITFEMNHSAQRISGQKCLEDLDVFLAYFCSKNDYFAIATICIYLGKQDEAYNYIIMGLRNGLQNKNFKLILNLCKLASHNSFFSKKQLREFYKLLQSDTVSQHLSTYEYKYYLKEMTEIRNILIDNPFGMPQICIEISTTIQPDDYISLNHLLREIDIVADMHLSQSSKYLTLRHNSPDVLEIFLSDVLPNLFIFLGTISSIFFGTTKAVSELQNIIKTHKEIKGISLDNLIKEQELIKATNQNKDDDVQPPLNLYHVEKISYTINTNVNLPPELRKNTYYF